MEENLTGVRRDSTAWRLLPKLIAQPVVNLSFVGTVLETNQVTALRVVDTLSWTPSPVVREGAGPEGIQR